MDRSNEVFPRNDLPGTSKAWGRAVETRMVNAEKANTSLALTTNNGLRAVGGQLDTQSELLKELLRGRSTTSASVPAFRVSATTPNTYPVFSRDFTVAPPYGSSRVATVSVSLNAVSIDTSSSSITTWFEILSGTNVVWRRQASLILGVAPSAPPAWSGLGFSETFSLQVPEGQQNYQLRVYTSTFTATYVEAEIQNTTITFVYGDKV